MRILVIAEHDNNQCKTATANTLSAAAFFQADVDVLVAGCQAKTVVDEVALFAGVKSVIHADGECYQHFLAENMALLIQALASDYTHILIPATTFGKNILPRAAALLNVGQVSEVTQILSEDTFIHPIYAGNAFEKVSNAYPHKLLSIRTTAFPVCEKGDIAAPVSQCDKQLDAKLSSFVGQEVTQTERPELTSARVVVSGGRALQTAENFKMLETLADQLNAAIGASRAAVDAGLVPNDYQVGQTGKVVAPDLYIAIGISGAIQHVAGMKDSKIIVAINKDEEAPIFQIANYGLVGDLFKIVPELTAEIEKSRH